MNSVAGHDERTLLQKPLVLIGLMGAGKSTVGRHLARALDVAFLDADTEIESAAGRSVADIFAEFGEAAFRDGERKVIARLLEGPAGVLATGGGAFMDPETRALIKEKGYSIWLRADLDTLVARTEGRSHRPLLNAGDPRETLARLMDLRYPVYAEADLVIDTRNESKLANGERVLEAVREAAPELFLAPVELPDA